MNCIYCRCTESWRFQGTEHVIPQAFGLFGTTTPTLRCVCDQCNSDLGRELDQLLTRETIEGVSRYQRGQYSRESRRQTRLKLALADPNEAGDFTGCRVNLDGKTGQLMSVESQFHIYNSDTKEWEVYFLPKISSLQLPEQKYGRPGGDGGRGTWRCKIFAPSKDAHDQMVDALVNAGINYRPGRPFPNPWATESQAPRNLLVELTGEIGKPHKRAIAKILMNFVAFHFGCAEALRPRWDFLRRYVRHGYGEIKIRLSDGVFWPAQECKQNRLRDDSINICVENLDGRIIGRIEFYNLHIFEMVLVEGDSLDKELAYRYTPGEAPRSGQKRPGLEISPPPSP